MLPTYSTVTFKQYKTTQNHTDRSSKPCQRHINKPCWCWR